MFEKVEEYRLCATKIRRGEGQTSRRIQMRWIEKGPIQVQNSQEDLIGRIMEIYFSVHVLHTTES
jgi:hypothetical protein